MEIESLYSTEDEREMKTLQTKGILTELGQHCLEINLADSIKEVRARLGEAYAWLGLYGFSPENRDCDYHRVEGVLTRVAGRKIAALQLEALDPAIRTELDRHCSVIASAQTLDELQKAHLTDAYGWMDSVTTPDSRVALKSTLDIAAHRRQIELLAKQKSA